MTKIRASQLIIVCSALGACSTPPPPAVIDTAPPDPVQEPVSPTEDTAVVPAVQEPVIPDLYQLTAADVQLELGVPTLVRRDGAVQIMLYESGFCVLDLTLTETAPGEYYRVQHVAARSPTGAVVDFDACVANFLLDPYHTKSLD